MQGKGEPLPLQPIPKTKNNNKTKTNNKIKVVYTEDWTHPLVQRYLSKPRGRITSQLSVGITSNITQNPFLGAGRSIRVIA